MATKLSDATLAGLTTATVPTYDRAALTPGIVHFGVGNFHRAHQAVYLDRLFESGRDHDWAILGAGVLPSDARAREIFASQDYLTTVVAQSAAASSARITGGMTDMLPVGDVAATVAALARPETRIVSLTITEGGYFIDAATGQFDPGHPAIVADAASPEAPKTVFGLILAGLRARRAAGHAPFTVMCCDNIPHNGAVTRNTLTGLARLSDPGFADWIAETVAFPNGMVDRITPATGDREREIVLRDFAIADAWPVFCEDFMQWVLEDTFPAGRPALETVGVQFVPDVAPYEHMKIRILNGGHAIIAYPAGLLDIHFAHEAMADPLVRAFLRKIEQEEIIPELPPVPDTDLGAYFDKIEERFSNPKIGDTIRRLCLDGSNRQPKFIVPPIADRLAAGRGVGGLALASALWCRYCHGETESGAAIAPNDPNWDALQARSRAAREDPGAWLGMTEVYGETGRAAPFRDAFDGWLRALWAEGTEATIRRYLDGG
ncbi:mannitol dehydrogenase family protein [Paralimibaculum aggregatum]|uniref:Mannitol dehydrogenase family protein n=1 Tax=Paralimibaculum aggregatum TaxID=3036245 RepID=A0ABQ6LP82_9RHOB|nr:mannitol dehydrogenase family protein [Limibaculum sp. NKW23]GMG82628.1 mannitol dehydrogenase family protein [Limibaculum sp. NKW23]